MCGFGQEDLKNNCLPKLFLFFDNKNRKEVEEVSKYFFFKQILSILTVP